MDGGIQNRSSRETGELSTLDWPAPEPTKFFSNGFWVVALFTGIGLAVLLVLGLSQASLCTGIDLNVGCVPIEMTGQIAE
jgi:hypothetical protein